jgi:hypothetical protein
LETTAPGLQNHTCFGSPVAGPDVAIIAENSAGARQTVAIQNSYIHDPVFGGIITCTDQTPPTLTANVRRNYIVTASTASRKPATPRAEVSGNFVEGELFGIFCEWLVHGFK